MEVLLAMAIGAIVLGAITMAIDFHLRVVDRGRQSVEEGQLARALLRRIADDLRSAVRYDPLDVSALLAQTSTASSAANSGSEGSSGQSGGLGGSGGSSGQFVQAQQAQRAGSGGSSSAGSSGGQSGTAGSSESGSAEIAANTDIAQSAVMSTIPGLYGNRYELQVDVSRLPRIEQYQQLLEASAEGAPVDVISDVKSVAYYVLDGMSEQGTGLVRRELDRAVTSWATQNGGLAGLDLYQELLAPEVIALEFQYFDGFDWYQEWDSTINKGLPMAIEIALAISSTAATELISAPDLSTYSAEQPYRVYRLLVHLPASRSAEEEAAAEAAAAAAATATSQSSSSSQSSGTSQSTGAPP